jgi:hypothetical protein
MSGEQMREILDRLSIGQTELARWGGVSDRAIRHYIKGVRPVPPYLALLLLFLDKRPEATKWFKEHAVR